MESKEVVHEDDDDAFFGVLATLLQSVAENPEKVTQKLKLKSLKQINQCLQSKRAARRIF